ncbi:MAG: hypothetical protein IKL65_02100, partial [Bacilli bacterium]|nr:hypothetical protein [Bacilli bacterium]
SQALVDQACNGISMSVKVGTLDPVTTSQSSIQNHTLATNTSEVVTVTISYAENAALADGAFNVSFGDVSLIYSSINDYVVEGPKGPICKPVEVATTGTLPAGNYSAGDEYTCNVKDDVWYTFFVVGTEGDYVNLLMYSNINDDGVPVDSDEVTNKGLVAWNESGNLTEGPVTAIEYLNRATSTWDNIDPLNEEFSEIENMNTTNNYTIHLTGKARLLSETEFITIQSNEYIFNYLADMNGPHTNSVSGVPGYWLMNTWYGELATYVNDQGTQNGDDVGNNPTYGVRPVIKVAMSQIE